MEQALQRGFRVEILSRHSDGHDATWENGRVGYEAIVEYSSLEKPERGGFGDDVDHTKPLYSICILNKGTNIVYSDNARWYEEKYLQLICSNEVKGKKILDDFKAKKERCW